MKILSKIIFVYTVLTGLPFYIFAANLILNTEQSFYILCLGSLELDLMIEGLDGGGPKNR